MPDRLAGRTALVTGGGNGLGRAMATALAERDVRVVVAGRTASTLEHTSAALGAAGHDARVVLVDVSDPDSVAALGRAVADEEISILVNNAGVAGPVASLVDVEPGDWDDVFATNVRSYFLLAKAVRPQMLARGGGAIVNVASVTFYWGEAGLVSYVASKGAVIGFTRSLAREAGPEGIRVNAVAPGAFPTAATAIHADQDALWNGVLEAQSIKRRGEVEDVARAIAFFAGDDSGFVSGQTLLVDGGWMRG